MYPLSVIDSNGNLVTVIVTPKDDGLYFANPLTGKKYGPYVDDYEIINATYTLVLS